jgi:hypothetical protein
MNEVLEIAKNCRHYAMCKIDFLGSGVCSSGTKKHYVGFYPQGRMVLYAALAEKKIPVTEKSMEIAYDCDLCGKCDYQCYFVNELRPSRVMKALKDYLFSFRENGGEVMKIPGDPLLDGMRMIVGDEWAANDPGITVGYSHDLSPLVTPIIPDYVVMPDTKEEISSLIKLFNKNRVPYTIRGNGANLLGFTTHEGVIMDLNRMKTIAFDEKNWMVKIGPGVAAFDLQREAQKRGYRINTSEPAALMCGNIMCSGIMSIFSTTYGTNAENFVDAEFVDKNGEIKTLNDISAPNLFSFKNTYHPPSPGVCTSAGIKLHPVTEDEKGILAPFQTLEEALDFIRDCAVRRIGLAMGIIGSEYVSAFLGPTKKLAIETKKIFTGKLDMPFLVVFIGDKYAIKAVQEMGVPFIDQRLFSTLQLGLPALNSAGWLDLIREMSEDKPFSYLNLKHFTEMAETALAPSPEQLTQDIDPDLRPFFKKLYARPEMTDIIWLNMFRIVSARIGRIKPFIPVLIYAPIDNALITELNDKFHAIAESHQIYNDFGFITPIDNGKRCIFEYDYFFDHKDPDEIVQMQQAITEANKLVDEYSMEPGTVRGHPYVLYQGFCRMENLLYT